MSTRIRVIQANDFIKATSEGSLDLEESKRLLRTIAVRIDPVVNYDAMLDTRQARSAPRIQVSQSRSSRLSRAPRSG